MTAHHEMTNDARTKLVRGSLWRYKGHDYVIEKITILRLPTGWMPIVNYLPTIPVEDAPNDYNRFWDDFLDVMEPAS